MRTNWVTLGVVVCWAVYLASYFDLFGAPSTWRATVWALFGFATVFFVACALTVRRARTASG
jgi:hypothetical protein